MEHHDHAEHELADFRAAKDEFMRNDPYSPLTREQRHIFKGLVYYPWAGELRLERPLNRDVPDDIVTLETSTGDSQQYRRAGKIRVEVDGQEAELTIFEAGEGDLFAPLRDATSGTETYGAGRYLEPEYIGQDRVLVDFNYLYNPYCAYNEQYSCPLPPRENWLQVPIRAGEKKFHE